MNRTKEEEKKRRYVNTPNGRVDLQGGTVDREKWMEMLNESDSWERSIRKRKEFERSHPREGAIKLLRDEQQHYLLNRSRIGIDRLHYRTQIVSDHSVEETEPETFELVDLPPESFVGIGSLPGEAQRKRRVWTLQVEWEDGKKNEKRGLLKEWSPHDGGTHVSNLDLQYVPRYTRQNQGE